MSEPIGHCDNCGDATACFLCLECRKLMQESSPHNEQVHSLNNQISRLLNERDAEKARADKLDLELKATTVAADQHCHDAMFYRREYEASKSLWISAQNACADHARRADRLGPALEGALKYIIELKAEIASHHEETQQVCGYKKLIDMEAKLAAQAGLLEKAVEDIRYIAEQCESVGRVEGIDIAESRTWKVVGRLARESLALIQAGKEK